MATITEDYVSFDTAKLLKERGFNEACDKKYFGDDCSGPSYIRESWEDGGGVSPMSNSDLDDGSKYTDISAPTLQVAMKWLREVHNLYIDIRININNSLYSFQIYSVGISGARAFTEYRIKSYEAACEEAINYCLKNLI